MPAHPRGFRHGAHAFCLPHLLSLCPRRPPGRSSAPAPAASQDRASAKWRRRRSNTRMNDSLRGTGVAVRPGVRPRLSRLARKAAAAACTLRRSLPVHRTLRAPNRRRATWSRCAKPVDVGARRSNHDDDQRAVRVRAAAGRRRCTAAVRRRAMRVGGSRNPRPGNERRASREAPVDFLGCRSPMEHANGRGATSSDLGRRGDAVMRGADFGWYG